MNYQGIAQALRPLVERVRTDVTAAKTERGMVWTREALTEVRLKRHLNGGQPRGVCPIKAGESTTRVALFDLDSHKGETPWEEMVAIADTLRKALESYGYLPVVFRSSGGRGIHIFLIWDEPQDAYSVRQSLRAVLERLGLKDGAKGVAQGEIEIFPKQDAVPEDGFGNQFILPLAGASAPMEPLLDLEVMPREYALELDWKPSADVPVVEKPVVESREVAIVEGDEEIDRLRSALAAINNDDEGLGYDDWRDIVVGVHSATGGSEIGYELAYEFSARSSKFDEAELRDKVWGWATPGKAGGITSATVFAKAREAGWNDVSPEDFPDLSPVVRPDGGPAAEGHEDDLPLPPFKRDGKGAIEPVVANLRAALSRVDVCGMEIRYDGFRDEIVFCPRGEAGLWRPFRDEHYFELRLRLEGLGFKPVGREIIRDAVHYQATQAPIDTAMVWLDGLKWDGKPRVERFLETYFGVEPGAYARAVSRYWWTALAGRVMSPGCQADMAVILVSPQQGLRKSSAVAAMVPPDTHRVLNFGQSETERARLMRGCLSVELAELHGLKTRAKEEIRAWITKRVEEWTPKFKEFSVQVPRRCVFCGTSNPTELFEEFERRWLPVSIVGSIKADEIARDRDQLWAEALTLWTAEGVAWQEAERLVRTVQDDYRIVDTWEAEITAWAEGAGLEGAEAPGEVGFQTRDVLVEALGFMPKAVRRGDEMRCANALKNAGFEQKVEWREGKSVRIWRKPLQPSGL